MAYLSLILSGLNVWKIAITLGNYSKKLKFLKIKNLFSFKLIYFSTPTVSNGCFKTSKKIAKKIITLIITL